MKKGANLRLGDDAMDGLRIDKRLTRYHPTHAELEVATAALDAVPGRDPLYARIDLLPSDLGPTVLEAELIEPSLFLDRVPRAAKRLADAIAGLATAGTNR
jgi:hypothetical protein